MKLASASKNELLKKGEGFIPMRKSLLLSLIIVLVGVNMISAETTTYTPYTETTCNGGRCTVTQYSTNKFTNISGTWQNFTDTANLKWEGGGFNFSYSDWFFTLEPFVIYNGNPYNISQIRDSYPDVSLGQHVSYSLSNFKFDFNLTSVPQNLVDNTDYIGLRLLDSGNLSWADIKKNGNGSITIKNETDFSFLDLVNNNYTTWLFNRTTLLIGNIAANYVNESLSFDPSVELSGSNHSADAFGVNGVNSGKNFGACDELHITTSSTLEKVAILRFNNTIPANKIISSSELCLNLTTDNLDVADELNISFWRVNETYQFTEGTGNCGGVASGGTNFTYLYQPGVNNLSNSTANTLISQGDGGRTCYEITEAIREAYAESETNYTILIEGHNGTNVSSTDRIEFLSKEHADSASRPLLNITYSSIINITLNSPPDDGNTSLTPDYNWTVSVDSENYTCNLSIDGTVNISGINVTNMTAANLTLNWSAGGEHEWNITCNDSTDSNTSPTYNLTIDGWGPDSTIVFPTEGITLDYNNSISLNYTVSDVYTNVDVCWYKVVNSTGTVIDNTTIASCANTTFDLLHDEDFTLTFYANDSYNNINSSNVNFSVSTTSPAINLFNPTNNQWLNYSTDILFNFTLNDTDGVNVSQLWSNWSGTWEENDSISHTATDILINYTKSVDEGSYWWSIWANDSLDNGGFYSSNFTVNIDTTFPVNNITNIITTEDSQTITFNLSYTETNTDECFYFVLNSTGGRDANWVSTNTSVACDASDTSAAVSAYGTYSLEVWIKDLATNWNMTNKSFTTSASGGGGGGGGGGGISPPKEPTEPKQEPLPDRCGNSVCESDEDPLNCPEDCRLFSLDEMFCTPFPNCGNWNRAWFINTIVVVVLGGMVYMQQKGKKIRRPI